MNIVLRLIAMLTITVGLFNLLVSLQQRLPLLFVGSILLIIFGIIFLRQLGKMGDNF